MKTQIKLQIIEAASGKIQASFRFEFKLKNTVILLLHRIFPMLLSGGATLICDQLEFPFSISGVQFQQGKMVENPNTLRHDDYEKTGN